MKENWWKAMTPPPDSIHFLVCPPVFRPVHSLIQLEAVPNAMWTPQNWIQILPKTVTLCRMQVRPNEKWTPTLKTVEHRILTTKTSTAEVAGRTWRLQVDVEDDCDRSVSENRPPPRLRCIPHVRIWRRRTAVLQALCATFYAKSTQTTNSGIGGDVARNRKKDL
jgi:hypothetical protein